MKRTTIVAGDIAFLLRAPPFPDAVGRIVRVIGLANPPRVKNGVAYWQFSFLHGAPASVRRLGGRKYLSRADCLVPIRPWGQAGDEEKSARKRGRSEIRKSDSKQLELLER